MGTGILLEPSEGDGRVLASSTSAGALLGFGLSYRAIAPAARQPGLAGPLEVELVPLGLLRLAAPTATPRMGDARLPLLYLRYRF